MEFVLYALAAVGALALVLVAGVVIAGVIQPEEPRHIDPDLLIEMPHRAMTSEATAGGGCGLPTSREQPRPSFCAGQLPRTRFLVAADQGMEDRTRRGRSGIGRSGARCAVGIGGDGPKLFPDGRAASPSETGTVRAIVGEGDEHG